MVNYKTIKIDSDVHEKLKHKKHDLDEQILDDPSFGDTIEFLIEQNQTGQDMYQGEPQSE